VDVVCRRLDCIELRVRCADGSSRMAVVTMAKKRRELHAVSLDEAIQDIADGVAGRVMIIGPRGWNALLEGAYERGWLLLEVKDETPVGAYRRNERKI